VSVVKYSKCDRALAILICQLCALRPEFHGNKRQAAKALGVPADRGAGLLAFKAWSAAADAIDYDPNVEMSRLDAEAECLLRDGWSPDESVVRLGRQRYVWLGGGR
jgi:hypothetical protein